ncbi:MAG TPA: VCBS repeat-containing protein [bacterium]
MPRRACRLGPKVLLFLAVWLVPYSAGTRGALVPAAAAATPAPVTVTAPAAGAVLQWGKTYRVAWRNPNLGTSVRKTRLSISLDGGLHWQFLATLDRNPGSYSWRVHEVPGVMRRCLLNVALLNWRGETIGRGRTGGFFTIRGVVSRYGIGAVESWYLPGYTWGKAAAGDLDGDGRSEIAVLSSSGSSCNFAHVLRRSSDGKLPFVSTIATFGLLDLKDIAAGDLNGDGRADLAFSSVSTLGGAMLGRLLALYQDPASGAIGATSAQKIYGSDKVGDIVIGDFGGTSGMDVAGLAEPATAGNPGAVAIFLQSSTGPLDYERRYDAVSVDLDGEIHAGDVNADGGADLVVQSGERELSVIPRASSALPPGFGAAEPLTVVPATDPPISSYAVGDLDNDGRADLVVASGSTLRVFIRASGGGFRSPMVIPLGLTPRKVAAIDQDGDLLTDIVVDYSQGIAVLRQTCSHTFLPPIVRLVPCQSVGPIGRGSLFQSDVNGDGIPDIVVSGYNGRLSFIFGTKLP